MSIRYRAQFVLLCVAATACGRDRPSVPNAAARLVNDSPRVTTPPPQVVQAPPWWGKEFGVGVVSYRAMDRYAAKDVIRKSPSHTADTVAVLNRDSLCFARGNCVRSYDRMIEFGYEIPGWAILRFNDDSSWAQVILAPFDSTGPTGWVALKNDSARAILWRHLLADKALFFLRPTDIAFYAAPGDTTPIQRKLVGYANFDELDYIMRPLESRERWLRVVLLTPSPMCKFPEPTVTPDTVWIQYLTPSDRPKTFYYTRGC